MRSKNRKKIIFLDVSGVLRIKKRTIMSVNKKIAFLDVDGVLNNDQSCKHYHRKYGGNGYGGFFKSEYIPGRYEEKDGPIIIEPTEQDIKWNSNLVNNLGYIIEKTGAEIVISSTWRLWHNVDIFLKMFTVYGYPNMPVIDRTPDLNRIYDLKFSASHVKRGEEIQYWLDANKDMNIISYVILDDNHDFLPHQIDNFVHTNEKYGLTISDADKAIQILNRND